MLRRMREIGGGPFDVAVTSLGVNDVTAGVFRSQWRSRQAELRRALRDFVGVHWTVVCGLPPVHGFPALPQPLRWWLGARARQFDRDLENAVSAEDHVSFLSLRFTEDTRLMAADGFHPGPGVYSEWGRRAGVAVTALINAGRSSPTQQRAADGAG